MTAEAIIAAGIINYPYWLLLSEIKRSADWKMPSKHKVKVKRGRKRDCNFGYHTWAMTLKKKDKIRLLSDFCHSLFICVQRLIIQKWMIKFKQGKLSDKEAAVGLSKGRIQLKKRGRMTEQLSCSGRLCFCGCHKGGDSRKLGFYIYTTLHHPGLKYISIRNWNTHTYLYQHLNVLTSKRCKLKVVI